MSGKERVCDRLRSMYRRQPPVDNGELPAPAACPVCGGVIVALTGVGWRCEHGHSNTERTGG